MHGAGERETEMEHVFFMLIVWAAVSALLLALMVMGGILELLEKVIPGFCNKLVDFFCR